MAASRLWPARRALARPASPDAQDTQAAQAPTPRAQYALAAWELGGAALLAGAAVVAVLLLPDGSPARVVAALAGLAIVPGYAALALAVPGEPRWLRMAASPPVSVAVVGLAALACALVPGGFRAAPILASVAGVTGMLLAAAWLRQRRAARRLAMPAEVAALAGQAPP